MEIWLIIWGIWEAELILSIWGAIAKYFQEAEIVFRDLGRSMHLFYRAREHRPQPLWPQIYNQT